MSATKRQWHCPQCGVTKPEFTMPFPHIGCAPGTIVQTRHPFNAKHWHRFEFAYTDTFGMGGRCDCGAHLWRGVVGDTLTSKYTPRPRPTSGGGGIASESRHSTAIAAPAEGPLAKDSAPATDAPSSPGGTHG